MPVFTVLFDGWPLVWQPNSPAALHLTELLAFLPDEVKAIVALPGQPLDPLPACVSWHLVATSDRSSARLRWEQHTLPKLGRELGAQVVHLTGGHPALFASTPNLLSSTGFGFEDPSADERLPRRDLASRLRESLGLGGRSRAGGILWPSDLPAPTGRIPVLHLPPIVHPAFVDGDPDLGADQLAVEVPETYLLYHGPYSRVDLQRLFGAWSWAAGVIGESYPLLIVGMGEAGSENLKTVIEIDDFRKTVHLLPDLPFSSLVRLYQNCSALFHPAAVSPWGNPLRMALACGKPVVALETPITNALVGPAAYLVPGEGTETDRTRSLGAALLTVVIENGVAEALSAAAHKQAAGWHSADFSAELLAAYRHVTGLENQSRAG